MLRKIVLLLAGIFMLASTNSLFSQEDPCRLCKKDMKYQIPGTECSVIYDYCFFVDGDSLHNLGIGNYRFIGACSREKIEKNMPQIVDQIIDQLYSTPGLYPEDCWPEVPNCDQGGYLCNFKIAAGVCYEDIYQNKYGEWVFKYCGDIEQVTCFQTVDLCWKTYKDDEGNIRQRLVITPYTKFINPACPCKNSCW